MEGRGLRERPPGPGHKTAQAPGVIPSGVAGSVEWPQPCRRTHTVTPQDGAEAWASVTSAQSAGGRRVQDEQGRTESLALPFPLDTSPGQAVASQTLTRTKESHRPPWEPPPGGR